MSAAKPHAALMRQCLRDIDVNGMRKLHTHVFPQYPAGDDASILLNIHVARVRARWLNLKARAYSHRWLLDNGYPSDLPDHLKPKAERLYPRVVTATAYAFGGVFGSPHLRPLKKEVEAAVHTVILDTYATDKVDAIDHDKLRAHMHATKDQTIRKLVGRIVPAV